MDHGTIDGPTAKGLKALRARIDQADIPASALDESFNLATWNIREFGRKPRLDRSIHYIAEILNQFDLIAVVEVRDDLSDLQKVLDLLGPYWRVIYSDFIIDAQGNHERLAFVYDRRMVSFTGLAAEADARRRKDPKGDLVSRINWWRSPYMASFRAGSFDFVLLAAHIRWDTSGGEKSRARELTLLADWVDERSRQPHAADHDLLVVGDFNIPDDDGLLFRAVTAKGLQVPDAVRGIGHGSNLARDKRYDQILHLPRFTKCFSNRAGVLDFFAGDFGPLYGDLKKLNHDAITFQMSDHLPLWAQVRTDVEGERLDQVIRAWSRKPKG